MKREATNITNTQAPNVRVCIITAKFNEAITHNLRDGSLRALADAGVQKKTIDSFDVPGSVELPTAARVAAQSGSYDVIVCLGAVIRGETDHYRYVCSIAANGIREVGMEFGMPVMFGVLTCDTQEQAQERSAPDESNTGYQVTVAGLSMMRTLSDIRA